MNISELARHLDLAVSTVSRVLSGNAEKYRISPATADRIRQAAKEHQVRPDLLGSSLRKGSLGMIGLLVPDITNPFFSQMARAIELELRDSGIAVQLCDANEDAETEERLLQQMLARRLDGLIFAPVGIQSPRLSSLIESASFPIVLIDRVLPDITAPSVSIDNADAGRIAATHLLEAGHRRIACVRGATESLIDSERLRGIREALKEGGIPNEDLIVAGEGYSETASRKAAEQILLHSPQPSAVITLSGQGILSLLKTIGEKGISIPGEVSVVAFDEQPWSSFMHPALTTIEQPVAEMAKEAVSFLKSIQKAPSDIKLQNQSSVLKAKLIARDSVQVIGRE